jgi:hypothetical protein
MSPQPQLSQLQLWERHEARVLSILRAALALLATRLTHGGEPELNRELYFCILETNKTNKQQQTEDWFDYPPVWEAPNQPTPDMAALMYDSKIPDFHWSYLDHDEPDAARAARHFVIECKRLGQPTPAGWAFNAHYVQDGVNRFIDPAWRYGRDVASGAMVGYIQTMTVDAILAEVNAVATAHEVPVLGKRARPNTAVHELDHAIDRPFVVTPFRLTHLWVEAHRPLLTAAPSTSEQRISSRG